MNSEIWANVLKGADAKPRVYGYQPMTAGLQRIAFRYKALWPRCVLLCPFMEQGDFCLSTAMVVHESWLMSEIIEKELVECGFQVVCQAQSRLKAALGYRLHRPDVVLVDAMMNGGRGYQTVDDLLDIDYRASIVAMVPIEGESQALHSIVSGARGLLVVPFGEDVLKQELERVLSKRENLHLLRQIRNYGSLRPINYLRRAWCEWKFRRRTRDEEAYVTRFE